MDAMKEVVKSTQGEIKFVVTRKVPTGDTPREPPAAELETTPQSASGDAIDIGDASEQYLNVEMYIRCEGILATRGTKTDSFVRIILIEDNLTEHEVGKTETQEDSLDPEFRHPIQLRFRMDDETHRLRIELCDPGEVKDADAAPSITVLGAVALSLQDIVAMVIGGSTASSGTLRRGSSSPMGVSKLELIPLAQLSREERRASVASTAESRRGSVESNPETPKGKSHGLGRVVLVPEMIAADKEYCWFVFGATNLRTEVIGLPPSPFLRIFRKLADGTKAPVYETGHVTRVRECAWKTVPIPLQRLHNGDPLRMIVIEVWDYNVAGPRLFGYATLPASQMLQAAQKWEEHGQAVAAEPDTPGVGKKAASNIPLQRPSFGDARRGSLMQSALGFGRAKSPGALTILRAEIDFSEEQAVMVFKTFDVEGVRREASHNAPPEWTPLAVRYEKVVEEKQLGLRSSDTIACLEGCFNSARRWRKWLTTTDLRRLTRKYNPIHQCYLSIGSRFGSGIQSLFGFARTMIQLNIVLGLLFFCLVNLPQLVHNANSRDFYFDYIATISSQPVKYTDAPSLLYIGGYEPVYYNEDGYSDKRCSSDFKSCVVYHMDVAYFLCAFLGTFGISLVWLVRAISQMLKTQDKRKSVSGAENDAVGEMVELFFNGWDMLETTRRATNNMREHVATHLRQNLLQQNLVSNNKQAKSAKQLRDLAAKRVIFITLSVALLVGSTASIIVVLLDSPQKAIKDWGERTTGSNTFGELLPSLIVTVVNSISPVLIKIFVRMEQYAPENELRQAIVRIFGIKMLNLLVTAVTLDMPADLQAEYMTPTTYMEGCQESAAGRTYVQLIFSDAILVMFLTSVPKFFFWKIKCKPFGFKMIIDMPKEVMELVYRQALIWVAALYVPLVYPIAVIVQVVVYFVKYVSFRYLYKAPEKPFSKSNVQRLFLTTGFAALIVVVMPFSYAMAQTANPFCGPLRDPHIARLASNATGAYIGLTRLNYKPLTDTLMQDSIDFSFENLTSGAEESSKFEYVGSILSEAVKSCPFECWFATIIEMIFSVQSLLLVSVLLCINYNFIRSRLKRLQAELEQSEKLRAEEHADKVRLLRYNGVQL
jgi:hypothetical protein